MSQSYSRRDWLTLRTDRTGAGESSVAIDLGAHTLKLGYANATAPYCTPNCAVRCRATRAVHWAAEADACNAPPAAHSAPVHSHDRGVCVNWPLQASILERTCLAAGVELNGRHVVLGEAPLTPVTARKGRAELFFEVCGVESLLVQPSAVFANVARRARTLASAAVAARDGDLPASVIVDVGFSNSWIVPIVDNRAVTPAVRRSDVGGKVLDNQLAALISARHLDVRGEPALVGAIRAELCYVARDFRAELADRDALRARYLLPDAAQRTGRPLAPGERVASDAAAQILTLTNERISVPELLLHPSDVGFEQAGLAEAIVQAIDACPAPLAAQLYGNIELVGGCAQQRGLAERVAAEVRALAPDDVAVGVGLAPNPVTAAWHGAALSAVQPYAERQRVSKHEYEERGGGFALLARKELLSN